MAAVYCTIVQTRNPDLHSFAVDRTSVGAANHLIQAARPNVHAGRAA